MNQDKPKQPTTVIKAMPIRPKKKAVSSEMEERESLAYIAYYYPQYTLWELENVVAARDLPVLIKVAQREEAKKMLLLNNIIHGPNAKSQSNYKKVLESLKKLL